MPFNKIEKKDIVLFCLNISFCIFVSLVEINKWIKITLIIVFVTYCIYILIESFHKLEPVLLGIKEYKASDEVNQVLAKFPKLIGRELEVSDFLNFLLSLSNIAVLIGKGGSGKTRLSIEFAEVASNSFDWNVFFIKKTEQPNFKIQKNTLLILDEVIHYPYWKTLLDKFQKYKKSKNVKLLLITRPIFKNLLSNELILRFYQTSFIELSESDIQGFLREYYSEITDMNVIKDIVCKVGSNFDSAILLSEYYLESNEIKDCEEVIEWKLIKYINDIAEKTRIDSINIKRIIQLISLIRPIKWNQDKDALKLISNPNIINNLYDILESGSDIFNYDQKETHYSIVSDLLADHICSQYVSSDDTNFKTTFHEIFPFMSARIIVNIVSSSILNDKRENEILQVLKETWKELNKIESNTVEYFISLGFITGDLRNLEIVDLDELNIQHIRTIVENNKKSKPEILPLYAKFLVNISAHFYKQNRDEIDVIKKELKELYSRNKIPDILISLSDIYVNLISYYCRRNEIKSIENNLNELTKINEKHSLEELTIRIAQAHVNIVSYYASQKNVEKVESSLEKLNKMYDDPRKLEERRCLSRALVNSINLYIEMDEIDKINFNISILRKLNSDYTDSNLRENLVIGLYNSAEYFTKNNDWNHTIAIIEEIRNISNNFPDEKNLHLHLARILTNFTSYDICLEETTRLDEAINELKAILLKNKVPAIREAFAQSLYNGVSIRSKLGRDEDYDIIENYIMDLKKLSGTKPVKEIYQIIARTLLHFSYYLGKRNKCDEIEKNVEDIISLHNKEKSTQMTLILGKMLSFGILKFGEVKRIEKAVEYADKIIDISLGYNETEFKIVLAKALYNIIIYLKSEGKHFTKYLFILYPIRYYIPRETKTEIISPKLYVQYLLVKILSLEIKENVEKGETGMKEFVSNLVDIIRNKHEILLLINSLCDKLEFDTSNLLMKAYEELDLDN